MRDNGAEHILLDVREPRELAAAALRPCVEMPMRTVPQRIVELDQETSIVVICHTGTRSMEVCRFLDQYDFADVINLMGGIDAWSRQIDPGIPRY